MTIPQDKSNGYEEAAARFMSARNPAIGAATVREWSRALAPNSPILDLGCGHGVPISQTLTEQGFTVYGVDASATLIAAFRKRFPNTHLECAAVEDSEFFHRSFEGIVAWGLMFLLLPSVQAGIIRKVARALTPGGRFLFTSPAEHRTWFDVLTGRESISLGRRRYQQILHAEGLILTGEEVDEGQNHYYFVSKP